MKIYIVALNEKYPILDLIKGTNRFNEDSIEGLLTEFVVSNEFDAEVYLIAHDAIHFQKSELALKKIKELARVKPVLVSDCGDFPANLKIPNVYSLRNSFPPGQKPNNAIAIPYNVKSRTHLQKRNYSEKPFISFVGFKPKILSRRLIPKSFAHLMHPIISNGSIIRSAGIRSLGKINESILVARSHYGGARSLIPDLKKFEEEYEESFTKSDLVFTPRGDANQSARFYEVLSAGRIPVVPDTQIIYPKLTSTELRPVFISVKSLSGNLKKQVELFWSKLDQKKYAEIQESNRRIYQDYFDYRIFLINFFKSDVKQISNFVV